MSRGRIEVYDRLGLLLVLSFAAWTLVSAIVQDADPWPFAGVLAAATGAYALGRAWGWQNAVLMAIAIVLTILLSTVLSGPGAFSGGAVAPPLGYANANGALFTVGIAAAAVVAVLTDRASGTVLAVALFGLTIIGMSQAAVALAGGVLLVAVLAGRLGRWVALVAPVVVLGAVAITVALGVMRSTGLIPSLEARLSERRTTLWNEALQFASHEPVFGVGPGMFSEMSPTALADADARWAHSVYLQTAAETGVIGLALLGLLLLWVYGALYRSRQDTRVVVIGTATITALAVQASIDYLAHFPALVAITAVLTGMASSREGTSEPPAVGGLEPAPTWMSSAGHARSIDV